MWFVYLFWSSTSDKGKFFKRYLLSTDPNAAALWRENRGCAPASWGAAGLPLAPGRRRAAWEAARAPRQCRWRARHVPISPQRPQPARPLFSCTWPLLKGRGVQVLLQWLSNSLHGPSTFFLMCTRSYVLGAYKSWTVTSFSELDPLSTCND